jgi:hypothetical protein
VTSFPLSSERDVAASTVSENSYFSIPTFAQSARSFRFHC